MKREIRFRGRTKEGKWLYGSLVMGAFIVTDEMLKDVPIDKLGVEIIYGKVDESTVGQYTGLKDKNGKEIYEGDFLRRRIDIDSLDIHDDCLIYVHWGENGFVFRDITNGRDIDFCLGDCNYSEVVGNIYDSCFNSLENDIIKTKTNKDNK